MATEVEIETIINTDRSTAGLKVLRKDLRELISLQGQVGSGSANFTKLQQAINKTEGQIGDLTTSFQTLRGSGVERINSSLGVFREGLLNADTGKLKLGLQGLGTAMKAIPIFLLIEGARLLYENFDKVVELFSSGKSESDKLTASLELQAAAMANVSASYQRTITLSRAAGESEENLIKLQIEAGEEQLKRYVAIGNAIQQTINLKEREGEAYDEELKKLQENDKAYETTLTNTAELYLKLDKARVDSAKKAAEEVKKIRDKEEQESALRIAKMSEYLKIRNAQDLANEQSRIEAENAMREEELAKIIKQIDEEKNYRAAIKEGEARDAERLAKINSDKALKDLRNSLALESEARAETTKDRISGVEMVLQAELSKEAYTLEERIGLVRAAEEKILQIKLQAAEKDIALVKQYAQVLSGVNDFINQEQLEQLRGFEISKNQIIQDSEARKQEQINNEIALTNQALNNESLTLNQREKLKADSEYKIALIETEAKNQQIKAENEYQKQQLKIKKQQFEKEKALKLVNIAIDTASSLVKTTAQLGGVGAVTPAGIALLAGIAALGITQAAVVAGQDFDESGFAAAPTISPPKRISSSGSGGGERGARTQTNFDPTANTGSNQSQRIIVYEGDIRDKSKKVDVLEGRATFGN